MRVFRLPILVGLLAVGEALLPGQMKTEADAPHSQMEGPNPAPLGSADQPVRVSSGIMSGRVRSHQNPVFPQNIKHSGSGTIVMSALVDKAGNVVELKTVSGAPELRDGVLEAVKKWTYRPYLMDGEPVFVRTTIIMNICFGA